jgi:hypothetical protein
LETTLHIYANQAALRQLGLDSIDALRTCEGSLVKNHNGKRDVLCFDTRQDGRPVRLFVKRTLRSYWKHAMASLIRFGRVVSAAEQEWQALRALQEIGLTTCTPVAWCAQTSRFSEKFSALITESAPGTPLDEYLAMHPPAGELHRVLAALAEQVRRAHRAGICLPTLLARHVFVDFDDAGQVKLTLIDPFPLVRPLPLLRRKNIVRDLARLHLSIPRKMLAWRTRLRFFRLYAGRRDRLLLALLALRVTYVLARHHRVSTFFNA